MKGFVSKDTYREICIGFGLALLIASFIINSVWVGKMGILPESKPTFYNSYDSFSYDLSMLVFVMFFFAPVLVLMMGYTELCKWGYKTLYSSSKVKK